MYAPRLNVLALRKPFVTDVGITAPRYSVETITTFLVTLLGSFSGFVHTRIGHNASFLPKCMST